MPPPPAGRGRDLWLQHAAGLILFEDVRGYARERVDRGLDEAALQASFKAIDDVLYGLMMVMDGVTGQLTNGSETVRLTVNAELELKGALIQALNLRDEGDGMCMGFPAGSKETTESRCLLLPRGDASQRAKRTRPANSHLVRETYERKPKRLVVKALRVIRHGIRTPHLG